ncbi:FUSC family protein [Streptacidiphilus sp. PB12-B1b]|uniref:hypothetical protein n=1 Tax=Streptacidiphilus sp. PB12-B1b TaxID=2705012 RepID=UPI0015FAAADD|nr:hypothetical protein [Streptacidiphilus sp. PB12-B1b]QMU74409.1 FUSC family protein [Streptacidiphilus sp. PB12-B1b]
MALWEFARYGSGASVRSKSRVRVSPINALKEAWARSLSFVLVVFPTAMQLVGPARYCFYTFFLTLVALELGAVERPSGWQAALVRAGLTCVGTGVAVASGFLFERVRGQAHCPIEAGNDDHAD